METTLDTYRNCFADVRMPDQFKEHMRDMVHRLQSDFPGLSVRATLTAEHPRPLVSAVRIPPEHSLLNDGQKIEAVGATLQANIQTALDWISKDVETPDGQAAPGLRPEL